MSQTKKVIALLVLTILGAAAVAGGIYVMSTPTDISPKAASPQVVSIPTVPPRRPSPTSTPTPTSVPRAPGEEEITNAFDSSTPSLDLNRDGTVNTLDLILFRQKP